MEQHNECVICFDNMSEMACNKCTARFHAHCIHRMFKVSNSDQCPQCRVRLPSMFFLNFANTNCNIVATELSSIGIKYHRNVDRFSFRIDGDNYEIVVAHDYIIIEVVCSIHYCRTQHNAVTEFAKMKSTKAFDVFVKNNTITNYSVIRNYDLKRDFFDILYSMFTKFPEIQNEYLILISLL